jgi:two-component system, chemotaxis family, sensor kinase Cph1
MFEPKDSLTVDLTNCDREPIHIPGSIQPHGVLFALTEPELTIVQLSNNTLSLFGIAPEQLLNQPLHQLISEDQIRILEDCLLAENLQDVNPLELLIHSGERSSSEDPSETAPPQTFNGIIHRSHGLLILELEPVSTPQSNAYFNFYHLVKSGLSRLKDTKELQTLCQTVVNHIQRLTGFERVMVYRFDEQWNGSVYAEAKLKELDPYLHLHYPASDIPTQARDLYLKNGLRIIPDVSYQPVELIPAINPITQTALDLSQSSLRNVSPIHVEYLHNMGVGSSMSITLVKDKTLWGLIACHHRTPKMVPYEVRNACEFLGQVMSLELTDKEDLENYEYQITAKTIQSRLIEYLSKTDRFVEGLLNFEPNILDLVNAQGAILFFENQFYTLGNTPALADFQPLFDRIQQYIQLEGIFHTNSLVQQFPEAEPFKDVASGVMALSLSKVPSHCILWFRSEVIQTVNWGGNPNKPVEVISGEDVRLSPRKSFELWQETVRCTALPWRKYEINAALDFRNAIVGVVLRKAEELATLNRDLQRTNTELDAFAYIASHDLKEPLRGIHNYACFLMEDYSEVLQEDGKEKLKTLVRLSQRMEMQIDSLLHFSRLGRVDLNLYETDLNELVHHTLDLLRGRLEESKVSIEIPQPLPTLYCDRVLVQEVFSNLISNAIKYNDQVTKRIEIGFRKSSKSFYVRDNGIGIQAEHYDTIFRIFKRLHGPKRYGGGTGAGLTIVKKIVERHGGRIWIESTPGKSTTFFFTLPL